MAPPRKTPPQKSTPKAAPPVRDLTARARETGASCIAFAARNFARRITQVYDGHLEPHGLSLPQFSMLIMIAAATDDTLAAIAASAGLDPSTLTRNLQTLEKLGWVEIASVEKDMRRRAVWLTEAGARKLTAAIPAWEAAQAEISSALGGDIRAQLRKAAKAL
jgi:DNA-binding MarR family transcriptional regulator